MVTYAPGVSEYGTDVFDNNTVVIYLRILQRKFNIAQNTFYKKIWKMLISRCCFAEDGGETDQVILFTSSFIVCSLTLLVGGVLHDVAVVVFLNSLLASRMLRCR